MGSVSSQVRVACTCATSEQMPSLGHLPWVALVPHQNISHCWDINGRLRTSMPACEALHALVPADLEGELAWQAHTQSHLRVAHEGHNLIGARTLRIPLQQHHACAYRNYERNLQNNLSVVFVCNWPQSNSTQLYVMQVHASVDCINKERK